MKKNYGGLDAYLKQLEARERILKQLEPFREMQETIRKSVQPAREALEKALGPALAAQEHWRHLAESARLPQIPLPDLPPIVKQVIDFQKAFQELISPAFQQLHQGFQELPARTQEALLILGQHGWYMDPEMSHPSLWELKDALSEGDITEAEAALVEYFEERISEIEASITKRFPHRSHLINSAFGAHRREEYVLSIPVLLAQVDGICKETVGQYLFMREAKKPSTAVYVARIAADAYTAALLSPLAEVLPISASVNERPEGFSGLNRHIVLHGESLDYGCKVNSLKAISLVNYVAHVLPADNP